MLCSWCGYNTNLVYSDFNGYVIFDEYGYANNSVRFCSINCCVAFINSDDKQSIQTIDKKIDYLYKYYNLTGFITEAPRITKLKHNGGTMTYEEYREEFKCPDPNKIHKNYTYEPYDEYKYDDYDNYHSRDMYESYEPYEYFDDFPTNSNEKES